MAIVSIALALWCLAGTLAPVKGKSSSRGRNRRHRSRIRPAPEEPRHAGCSFAPEGRFSFGDNMHRGLKKGLQLVGKPVAYRSLCASIGFTAVCFVACVSYAQVDRSGLSGTITDSAGRLLPQAHIAVVENATELRREAISDSSGNYSIPQLPVGVYTVTVEHQGFKKVEFVDVQQVIGRTRTLD